MQHEMQPIINAISLLKSKQSPNTPLCAYVYHLDALAQHARAMMEALPSECELYYAAKANPDAQVLATLAPILDGFEAASGGELQWLNQCQPESPLIFGGPGKLPSELESAIDLNVDAIHVESLTELRRIGVLCQQKQRQCRILLRMNIALEGIAHTRLTMGGKPTPFGIDASELPVAMAILNELPQIGGEPAVILRGFHFHLMSHQLDVERHLALMALYIRTFKQWCADYQLDLPLLNVGGGIGVNYAEPDSHFDWPRFCTELASLIQREQLQGVKLRFECGRFITAAMGYYVMQVLDIKQNHGEWFAIAHGGTHHFRTPAAQNHDHPFVIVPQSLIAANAAGYQIDEGRQTADIALSIANERVTFVGQLCTPKDVLAKQQWVTELAIGDYLVFTHAGAYAWNISHQHFLMHEPPKMHFIVATN